LLAKKGTSVIAMDMVPRISRAQKMDALSSMANIPVTERSSKQVITSAGFLRDR
jgi:NAD/NADP transhydrogenase alpha subunit